MLDTDEQVRETKKSKTKKKKQKYKTSTQRFTSQRLREEVTGRAEPAVKGAEFGSGQASFEASLTTRRKGSVCQDEDQDRMRGERSRWRR